MNTQSLMWNTLCGPEVRERMVTVALRCGAKSRTEAEDCVQDALLSAVRSGTGLDELHRADAWLAHCVANATRMRIRATRRARRGGGAKQVEYLDEVHDTLDEAANPERLAAMHEILAQLESVIANDRDGELLDACLTWEGTMRSLADARGENIDAFKTRLRRLRLRLRAALDAA